MGGLPSSYEHPAKVLFVRRNPHTLRGEGTGEKGAFGRGGRASESHELIGEEILSRGSRAFSLTPDAVVLTTDDLFGLERIAPERRAANQLFEMAHDLRPLLHRT